MSLSKAVLPEESTKFKWTLSKLQAARLIAEGQMADYAIAEKVNVNSVTIGRWKAHPDFRRKVVMYLNEINESVLAMGVANKSVRVGRLNERYNQIQEIVRERGESAEMQNVPGGKTGLLVHDVKGAAGVAYDVYKVDTALLGEEREIAKQAAVEMGQWNKNDEQPDVGANLTIEQRVTNIVAIFNGARERRGRETDPKNSGELSTPARVVSPVTVKSVEQQS